MITCHSSQCYPIIIRCMQPILRLLPPNLDKDEKRKRLMAITGIYILIPIMVYFIFIDIRDGRSVNMYMDIGLAVLFLLGLKPLTKMKNGITCYRILIASFTIHCCYNTFFVPGGDSSLIWVLITPPVVFFILSVPEGLYWFLVMFVINFVVINFTLIPNVEQYSDYMRIRIFIAWIIVAFFSFSFELLRWRFFTQLETRNKELRMAIQNVHTLQGLLPICSICKRIRDDKGYWKRLEEYLSTHTDVTLTHGICDACMKEYYPDVYEVRQKKREQKEPV